MATLPLQSSDGEIFYVNEQVANCFGTIRQMLEMSAEGLIGGGEVIPLPNVNSVILRKVLEWADFHKDDPPPSDDYDDQESRTVNMCQWDVGFLNVDQRTLFKLLMAASYLDATGLYKIVCEAIASMMRGTTPAQNRTTFNIPNDLTPADKQRIRKDNLFFNDP